MKHWQIIAYDIRDPKRLRQVHRHLRKHALRLQQSVYAIEGSERELKPILDGVRNLTDQRVDDVRLYPISHPGAVWAAGRQTEIVAGLHDGGSAPPQPSRLRRIVAGLLGREAA